MSKTGTGKPHFNYTLYSTKANYAGTDETFKSVSKELATRNQKTYNRGYFKTK